jgi:hypothetical protein
MHPRLNPLPRVSGNGEKLEAVTELGGVADILRGQAINAFPVNALKGDRHAEGYGYKDSQLVGRIRAVHVQGRRIFRVPEPDGLFDGPA